MGYQKQNWVTGDVVTADKLNHVEEGIVSANNTDIPAITSILAGDNLTGLYNLKLLKTSSGYAFLPVFDTATLPANCYALMQNEGLVLSKTNYYYVQTKIPATIRINQDGYLFDNKLLVVDADAGGYFKIYNFPGGDLAYQMKLDKYSINAAHGNSVMKRIINNTHYCYANIYNAYTNARFGELCVYEINDASQTNTLVQFIKLGFAGDGIHWPASTSESMRPYGNFILDLDHDLLYAYTVYGQNASSGYMQWYKMRLPAVTEGTYSETYQTNTVIISADEILDTWQTEFQSIPQGATYYNNLLWCTSGSGGSDVKIRVVDPEQKRQIGKININDFTSHEAELIDFKEGVLYYGSATELYVITLL